jgi:serine/threonine protein kinase
VIAYESEWNTYPDGSVANSYSGNQVSVAEAIRIMADTCRGVEHLHVRGILHRDIKPGNLQLTRTGSASNGKESS